jgi:hypothetical protein
VGRFGTVLLAGALAALGPVVLAVPARSEVATPTTTAPRADATATTVSPARVDEIAKRYGLLRTRDLPTGYAYADLERDDGARPSYPSVFGECDGTKNNAWSGPLPISTGGSFVARRSDGSAGATGTEIVRSFASGTSSTAYFRSFAEGLTEMGDCGLTTSPSGAIGTYAELDVGKIGDERAAVSFDPRAGEVQRISIARSGKRLVYVELNDDDASDAEFRSLVKLAHKRATD